MVILNLEAILKTLKVTILKKYSLLTSCKEPSGACGDRCRCQWTWLDFSTIIITNQWAFAIHLSSLSFLIHKNTDKLIDGSMLSIWKAPDFSMMEIGNGCYKIKYWDNIQYTIHSDLFVTKELCYFSFIYSDISWASQFWEEKKSVVSKFFPLWGIQAKSLLYRSAVVYAGEFDSLLWPSQAGSTVNFSRKDVLAMFFLESRDHHSYQCGS